jgi:hypothetical protein
MYFLQILPFPERVIGRKSLPYEAVPTAVYRIHKIPKRFRQKGIERRENKNKSLKFKIMDNIKESKEYQLAKDWERAVNDYGFNPKRFAAAIPEMHPTLQQSLYRLVKECIVVMADETRNYDDRNRASHEEAKRIMEYLKANGRHIPLR